MRSRFIFVGFISMIFLLSVYSCSKDSNPVDPNTTPSISSLSRNHAEVGTEIEINGNGFIGSQGSGYVDFAGTKSSASDITQWSDTKVKVKVPAGAQSGNISITNSNSKKSNEFAFTVDVVAPGGPYIDNINPGGFNIGDVVEIHGRNFGNMQGAGYVDFNTGRPGLNDYVQWTDNLIKVKAPTVNSSGKLYVFQANNKSNEVDYMITGFPFIISISPPSQQVGKEITIGGQNFGATRGTSVVNFSGYRPLDAEYTSWSDTQIKVLVPQNVKTGKVNIIVNGKSSNYYNLTILAPTPDPVLTSISPNPAQIGQELTLTGNYFGATRDTSYVKLNGVKVVQYTSWSDTQIKLNIPQGITTGGVNVVVRGIETSAITLTIGAATNTDPAINYLDASLFQAGQSVGINGKNFGATRGSNYVDFNGLQPGASDYTTWTDTKIVVKSPAGATTGKLKVVVGAKTSNLVDYQIQQQNYIIDCALIAAGSFQMGSTGNPDDDAKLHAVNITKDFYMSKTEISQKDYKLVMNGSNPSKYADDSNPVEQLTWDKAVEFCNRLSQMVGLNPCYTINGSNVTCDFNANGYRLPTEAEWEYASRAGATGDNCSTLSSIAWFQVNSSNTMHNVGTKNANAWGLFDMLGNAIEWVWDYYEPDYYTVSPQNNPTGPSTGSFRACRGGSFRDSDVEASYWKRDSHGQDFWAENLGFRVVRNK